ncbi:haloacid dehalogenase type II [Amylibacter sp.]|jgi:2-haloacid dehalogenase|nr:haloacid dehalogenase type II [Amylibacter sp.]MDA8812144.1 haloacid dehalogenase type II [Amylibacter sp.]MDB2600508.1 haloacid dehalogenase type II [Amylibacter sp.]
MVNICIFDAYGTLFDVTSATRIVANEEEYSSFPNHSVKVSNSWRIKQLEYSWLRNIMHEYIDFWQITKDALDFALEENQIKNEKLRQRLLDVYWNLSAYPEAQDVLTTLKANNIQTGILSNGSKQMLNSAVVSANLKNYLDKIISIDGIEIYKPDPKVYQMVLDQFNCKIEEVLFISSNGWDIAGASKFGFTTLWVNRNLIPKDRLTFMPNKITNNLSTIPNILKELNE